MLFWYLIGNADFFYFQRKVEEIDLVTPTKSDKKNQQQTKNQNKKPQQSDIFRSGTNFKNGSKPQQAGYQQSRYPTGRAIPAGAESDSDFSDEFEMS